jgi:amino acid transporter
MNWIIEKLKRGLSRLLQWQTWAVIALFCFFGTLAYLVGSMALWTDSNLNFLHAPTRACRQLTNGMIISLFCGMIFVVFFAVLGMGEIQRYIEFNRHGATREARRALFSGIGWGVLTAAVAIAGLLFFSTACI